MTSTSRLASAAYRREEADAIRHAMMQARSAKHQRTALLLRTRRHVEGASSCILNSSVCMAPVIVVSRYAISVRIQIVHYYVHRTDMARTTLSMRLSRSSLHAVEENALVAAMAATERAASAEALRAAAYERVTAAAAAKAQLAWRRDMFQTEAAAAAEESRQAAKQRRAATLEHAAAMRDAERKLALGTKVDSAVLLEHIAASATCLRLRRRCHCHF